MTSEGEGVDDMETDAEHLGQASSIEVRRGSGKWAWWVIATLAGAGGIGYFYRGFFVSGFSLGQGDNGDGRLTQVIATHWASPFQFPGGFTDIGIFHPLGQGLMYSDTLFAMGVFAAPLQWLGVNPSLAFQWSLILISAVGYMSAVALLRWGARAPWLLAIAGAWVFACANGLYVASNHPQLITFVLIPTIPLLYLASIRGRSTIAISLFAAGAGAMFGVITFSAFYIGWFLTIAAPLILVIWLLTSRDVLRLLRLLLGKRAVRLLAAIAGFIPFAVLMVLTYAPLLGTGLARPIEDARFFALQPTELFNVSPTNVIWSPLLVHVFGQVRDEEYAMAPTPTLLVVSIALIALALTLRGWRDRTWLSLGIALTSTGVILWLLPVDWGQVFPWQIVYQIPGASAIRAIGRIEIIAAGLLVLGSTVIASEVWKRRSRGLLAQTLGIAVLAMLVAEQINIAPRQQVDIASVQALRSIPAPPPYCTSFALLPPFNEVRPWDSQTDAAIIAQEFGIPTWNGQSGGFPAGWTLYPMDNPEGYLNFLAEYPNRYGISGGCVVDLESQEWILFELAQELRLF